MCKILFYIIGCTVYYVEFEIQIEINNMIRRDSLTLVATVKDGRAGAGRDWELPPPSVRGYSALAPAATQAKYML